LLLVVVAKQPFVYVVVLVPDFGLIVAVAADVVVVDWPVLAVVIVVNSLLKALVVAVVQLVVVVNY